MTYANFSKSEAFYLVGASTPIDGCHEPLPNASYELTLG